MCSHLAEQLQKVHAKRAADHAEMLEIIAGLAATEEWRGDGATDLGSWVAAACQESVREARGWVREAEALNERPALQAALLAGEISVGQSKALSVLCEEGTDDDEVWLEALPFWSYSELEHEARKKKARELERKDGGTYFHMEHTRDERFMRGEFQLHPEDGALLLSAIEARIPKATMLRDWDTASAAALVELAKGSVVDPARRPTVLVSVPGDIAELGSGGFVSAPTAQRLSCDARIQELHTDAQGNIVGTRPNADPIPAATRRAVEARDLGRCTFPTCERDHYLECHHIVPREFGGSNEMSNLQLTCWSHHTLIHEGGWSLGDHAGPNNSWFRPDGTPFEPRVRVTLDTS
jgi:hypothetical protein